jgi:hypothetical protein
MKACWLEIGQENVKRTYLYIGQNLVYPPEVSGVFQFESQSLKNWQFKHSVKMDEN